MEGGEPTRAIDPLGPGVCGGIRRCNKKGKRGERNTQPANEMG